MFPKLYFNFDLAHSGFWQRNIIASKLDLCRIALLTWPSGQLQSIKDSSAYLMTLRGDHSRDVVRAMKFTSFAINKKFSVKINEKEITLTKGFT